MFEFPSYCSIYSSHGDINFDKPNFDGEACFKKIFDPLKKMARDEIVKNHYKIYLCKDIEFIKIIFAFLVKKKYDSIYRI